MRVRRWLRPGLRPRLWTAATLLAGLTMLSAGLAVYGLSRAQSYAHEAMAAQSRIEAYGVFSARVNDWMISWLTRPETPPDPATVLATIDQLDRLVAEDVAGAATSEQQAQRARQSMTPARLRGFFGQLEKTLAQSGPGTSQGDAAIAFYMAQAPEAVGGQITQETRRRENALLAMDRLQNTLRIFSLAAGLAAPLVLAALYLLVLRPLFGRLERVTASAESLASGQFPRGAGGHDELGLMLARLRQMARRLDRRRAGLERDSQRLEGIIAGRTADLSAANERLAQTDTDRRRLFADVGHELRTPLTVIMGEAELGARHPDPLVRAAFQTIMARGQRLNRRIEDILRIARSDSGQLELCRDRVALDQAISAALADTAPLLRRAGVSVCTEVGEIHLCADSDWVRQVFAGLFENASKYAGRGAEVSVTASAGDGIARIVITDTGPGLAPGLRDQVFRRFARSGNAPGFGVGLALAAWVVEASGGSMGLLPEDRPEPGPAEGPQDHRGLGLQIGLPLWEER